MIIDPRLDVQPRDGADGAELTRAAAHRARWADKNCRDAENHVSVVEVGES